VVVHAAVADEEDLPARELAVDHPRHVDAGLARQIAAELQHQMALRKVAGAALGETVQAVGHRRELKRRIRERVRDAEAAAEVQAAHRRRQLLGPAEDQLVAPGLRLDNRLGLQVLRAGVEVETLEGQPERADLGQQIRHPFGIDAELLGAAAHAHARSLQLERRVDADRHPRGLAAGVAGLGERAQLAEALDVDQDARGLRLLQIGIALARAGEADVLRVHAGIECNAQLADRSHVQPVGESRHVRDHRRHRVALHRVVQVHGWRQHATQLRDPRAQPAAVVDVAGRAADGVDHPRQRAPADQQFAAGVHAPGQALGPGQFEFGAGGLDHSGRVV